MTATTRDLMAQLVEQWNELGAKTAALGEAMTGKTFDEAPVAGVRSPAEVFRHLAFWNRWVAAKARGEEPDGSANEIGRSEAPNREKALAAFATSVADAAAALTGRGRNGIDADAAALCASFLGHTAEHYGQLAVYARMAGIVPPASR